MRIWDDILTARDKQVYAQAGYGQKAEFGRRPALLIIDVNYNFVGDKPEPILDSVKRFRNSCGEEGWAAVHKIRELLDVAQPSGIPIFYSTGFRVDELGGLTRWGAKNRRADAERGALGDLDYKIVDEIAPRPQDIVLKKKWPSVFFATGLSSFLVAEQADTLLICGCTTSGCVRATTVEAFSYNFRPVVIEECTFDRGQASHKINLFDMHQKYANVLPLSEVTTYLKTLAKG